jgi:hypothetical protein
MDRRSKHFAKHIREKNGRDHSYDRDCFFFFVLAVQPISTEFPLVIPTAQ